jgi:exodeoxyribonuclease V gamma subunit
VLLGKPVIDEVMPLAQDIVAAVPADAPGALDVRIALPGGRTLRGTVAGLAGDTLVTVGYERVKAGQRLRAWVRLLALAAGHPERRFEALTAGRARTGDGIATLRISPVDPDDARDLLADLLDLYDRGMREPPPLYPETSLAYARAAHDGGDPVAAARAQWESDRFPKEDADPAHVRVLGGRRTFDELYEQPARRDEHWELDETRRLGRWARRLWEPLLGREQA